MTRWYPTEENPAIGTFVREHARAVMLRNDLVVMHLAGYDPECRGAYRIKRSVEDGILTYRVYHKGENFSFLQAAAAGYEKIRDDGFYPQIIHASVFTAGVPAVIIGSFYKVPVVITEHWSAFLRKTLSEREIAMAIFAMQKAKCIMPVSACLQKNIQSYGIRNKFTVIPNTVNTDLFYPGAKPKKKSIKKMLVVGLLSPIKGIPFLFHALMSLSKKRNDFTLDIVGDGPCRAQYERLSDELGIRDKVTFHGLKTKAEVAAHMRQNDFLVLPSLFETFSCVVMEAMASGLPVVATDVGGVREIINADNGILVKPRSQRALKRALNFMLDHYTQYSPRQISQYARRRFSYQSVGKEITNVYRKCLR